LGYGFCRRVGSKPLDALPIISTRPQKGRFVLFITCPVVYCTTAGVWVPPGCTGCLQHVLASAAMRLLCPTHSEVFSSYLFCLSHTAAGALALPPCASCLQPSFPLVLTSLYNACGSKWRLGKMPTPPCHTTNAYSLPAPPPARVAVCRLYCRGNVPHRGAVHVQPSQLPDQVVNPAVVPPAVALLPPAAVLAVQHASPAACNHSSFRAVAVLAVQGAAVCAVCAAFPPAYRPRLLPVQVQVLLLQHVHVRPVSPGQVAVAVQGTPAAAAAAAAATVAAAGLKK
jgi:hypothetical protein